MFDKNDVAKRLNSSWLGNTYVRPKISAESWNSSFWYFKIDLNYESLA